MWVIQNCRPKQTRVKQVFRLEIDDMFLVRYNFRSPCIFLLLLFKLQGTQFIQQTTVLPSGHFIALADLICWKINLQRYWHLRIINAANVIENCYIVL